MLRMLCELMGIRTQDEVDEFVNNTRFYMPGALKDEGAENRLDELRASEYWSYEYIKDDFESLAWPLNRGPLLREH